MERQLELVPGEVSQDLDVALLRLGWLCVLPASRSTELKALPSIGELGLQVRCSGEYDACAHIVDLSLYEADRGTGVVYGDVALLGIRCDWRGRKERAKDYWIAA